MHFSRVEQELKKGRRTEGRQKNLPLVSCFPAFNFFPQVPETKQSPCLSASFFIRQGKLCYVTILKITLNSWGLNTAEAYLFIYLLPSEMCSFFVSVRPWFIWTLGILGLRWLHQLGFYSLRYVVFFQEKKVHKGFILSYSALYSIAQN